MFDSASPPVRFSNILKTLKKQDSALAGDLPVQFQPPFGAALALLDVRSRFLG